MITEKNLKRVGFLPGEWEDLDPGDRYRTWSLPVAGAVSIEVDQQIVNGVTTFYASIRCDDYIPLNTDSVSRLLELKKLLNNGQALQKVGI